MNPRQRVHQFRQQASLRTSGRFEEIGYHPFEKLEKMSHEELELLNNKSLTEFLKLMGEDPNLINLLHEGDILLSYHADYYLYLKNDLLYLSLVHFYQKSSYLPKECLKLFEWKGIFTSDDLDSYDSAIGTNKEYEGVKIGDEYYSLDNNEAHLILLDNGSHIYGEKVNPNPSTKDKELKVKPVNSFRKANKLN